MTRRWNKRGLALLLTAALIFSQLGGAVLAQSGGGLCPHHPIHDAACGFEPGQACAFACADCADGDSGRAARVIAAFAPLEPSALTRVVPIGTALYGLALPTSLRVTLTETAARGDTDSGTLDSGAAPDAETATVEPIRWVIDPANPQNAGASEYAPTGGVFYFTAVLPQGWRLASDATLPELCVIVRNNIILPPFDLSPRDRPLYAEGEAVIVYELPDGPNRRSSAASLMGGGLHIEELMRLDDTSAAVADRAPSAKGLPRAAVSRRIAHVTGNGQSTEALIAELASYDFVEVAEPNYARYPTAVDTDHPYGGPDDLPAGYDYNDPYLSELWPLWGDFGVDLPDAPITSSSGEAVVAIFDTGVDVNHPDLAGMMLKDSDGNDVFFDADPEKGDKPVDDDGHGTHCAGIVAAEANNRTGIAGVAGNLPVKLMSVRVIGPSSGYTSDLVKGFNFIVDQDKNQGRNIVAVNASLGGPVSSHAEMLAISEMNDAGIILVVAAGNDDSDLSYTPTYPACYDLPNIITVGSHDINGSISSFSNYGRAEVEVTAPGTQMQSSVSYPVLNLALQQGTDVAEGVLMTFDDMTEDELNEFKKGFHLMTGKVNEPNPTEIDIDFSLVGPETAAMGRGGALALTFEVPPIPDGDDVAILHLSLPPPSVPGGTLPEGGTSELVVSALRENTQGQQLGVAYLLDQYEVDQYLVHPDKPQPILGASLNTDFFARGVGARAIDEDESPKPPPAGMAVVAQLQIFQEGEMTLLLDNYGFGKVTNVAKAQYDHYQGTSMAAPAATGVVAALAVAKPNLSPAELRARVIGGASLDIDRSAKGIASGGVSLNNAISGIEGFAPVIDSHSFDEQDNLVIDGWYFGDNPTVSINISPDEPGDVLEAGAFRIEHINSANGQDRLTITASALASHDAKTREIAIENNDGGAYRRVAVSKWAEPQSYQLEFGLSAQELLDQMEPHRVGDTLYAVTALYDRAAPEGQERKAPVACSGSVSAGALQNSVISMTPLAELDCEAAYSPFGTVLYGERIYLADQKHIHTFGLNAKAWNESIDLPAEMQGETSAKLVVLDGKLVVMGGTLWTEEGLRISSNAGLYDLATGAWSLEPNFLPIAAAGGKAVTAGGKIYYQPQIDVPLPLLVGTIEGLTEVLDSPEQRKPFTIAPWGDGALYLGWPDGEELGDSYTYQPDGSWEPVDIPFEGRGTYGLEAVPWDGSLMITKVNDDKTLLLTHIPSGIPAPAQRLRVLGAANVTVDGAPLTPGQTVPAGRTVTVTATDGYGRTASGWTTLRQVLALTRQPNGAVRFVMPHEEVTLTAHFPSDDSGGDDDNGGGGGGSPTPTPAPPEPNVSSSPVAAPPDANGTAKVAPDAASLTKSLDALKAQPGKPGAERVLELVPETGGAAARLELTLTPEAQKLLASAPMDSLSLRAKEAELRLPRTLLTALQGISTGDIGFAVEGVRPAPAQSWQLAGRPLYELSSHVTGTGGQRLAISDFGQPMTLALPYTLRPGETAAQITLLQVNPDGSMTAVPGAVYNPASGKVVASVSRPGRYAVGLPPSGGLAPLAPLPTAGGYTVGVGDSFWAIAQRHGVDMNALAAANGKKIGDLLRPGEKLVIPGK